MFRKEYKQANDNIKVDEALLERTLEAAFSEKPRKKTYYYRSFASLAAALVIVIGASSAYPKLVKGPEIEQTVTSTVSPTLNPDANLKFEATHEASPDSENGESKSASKPVSTPKSANKPVAKNASADKVKIAEKVQSEPAAGDVVVVSEIVETENAVSDAAALPSVARNMSGEIEAYNEPEQETPGFLQVSCKLADGSAEYVYENKSGKSFTVTVTDAGGEPVSGFYVEQNGKLYIFSSGNMTQAEIMEVFEALNI